MAAPRGLHASPLLGSTLRPRPFEFCTAVQYIALLLVFGFRLAASELNLATAARLSVSNGDKRQVVLTLAHAPPASALQLEWDEERDIQEVRIGFDAVATHAKSVEYWFKSWPYEPPQMPSMEDPLDDPWQGEWLKADVEESCDARTCRYNFAPLSERENPRAKNLPGTTYRRTLKIRISFEKPQTHIRSLEAFSRTAEREVRLSVELGSATEQGSEMSGWFSVYNGQLHKVRPVGFGASDRFSSDTSHWRHSSKAKPKFILDLVAAKPNLPGSNDETIVTVHATEHSGRGADENLSFSFDVEDLAHGPIMIPAVGARISGGDPVENRGARKQRIRARIPLESEQTIARASSEIPALDPVHREWGGPLYMPLAVDSSWQKFAFQMGGDIFISKEGLKAKPAELKRLAWEGDRLTWSVHSGENAASLLDAHTVLHPKDGYLPIAAQSWRDEGFGWDEEAFATPLRGPLSPYDPARSEDTPSVLLLRISARDLTSSQEVVVLWLSTDESGSPRVSGNRLFSGDTLRAVFSGASCSVATLPRSQRRGLKCSWAIAPGESKAVVLKLPAVTDLGESDIRATEKLDFVEQRDRVETYWRKLVQKAARISVPEPVFNAFLRSTVAHIHVTATKDPQTGLIMLPAASYIYDVYENESCYQLLLLDALGQSADAAAFLKPMLELQGSKNFPGAQTGSFTGVFHGVKISDALDYTANGYGLDQGTVLWTLAQHYLYTRDKQWFRGAWPHMQKAIEWIEKQRAATRLHNGDGEPMREYGLLPASKLEDNNDWANWFSINGFAWAGMDLTGKILTELNLPEAAAVGRAAADYKADLRRAILRATEAAPVVRLQDGTYQPYVPTVPTRRFRLFGPLQMNYYARYGNPELKPLLRLGADRDTLCGTVLLLILGVFEPDEPIANWILNDWEDNETLSSGMGMNIHGMTDDKFWFSQGGMVFQANLVNPISVYLKRHEVPAAIRNLYNDFVACLYPQANQFTEEFHQWVHASGPFYKSSDEARFVNRLRDMLVLEDNDTLWLAPGTPRRWLKSKEGVQVTDAPTFFGPVSYTLHAGSRPNTVDAVVGLPVRNPAKHVWLVVRTPSHHINSVTLNGRQWQRLDRSREAIDLSGVGDSATVEVEY